MHKLLYWFGIMTKSNRLSILLHNVLLIRLTSFCVRILLNFKPILDHIIRKMTTGKRVKSTPSASMLSESVIPYMHVYV